MAGSIDLPTLSQKYRLDTSSFDKGAKSAEDRAKRMATSTTGSLGGATTKIGGLFGKLDGLLGQFGLPFEGALEKVGGSLENAGKHGESFGNTIQKIGGTIAIGAAAGLAAFGAIAVKEALDGEASHARLETAIHNAGQEYGVYAGRIDVATTKLAGFGFKAPEVASSLATLTGVTHDAGKAIDLESLAADIARGRHIDLASATGILTKVETGHVALLGKLGIATKDSTGATISSEEALKRLTALYGGQASAYAGTFQGKLAALEATASNFAETVGEKILPVLTRFISDGLGVISFIGRVNTATDGWIGKLALLAAGLSVATFAVGKFEAVAAGIPLIGGALAGLAAPAAIAGAAFLGLRAVVGHFADDGIDSAKATGELATGLQQLGKNGTESYLVFQRLGDNFSKLVKSFHDVHDATGGFVNDVDNWGLHLVGASSLIDDARAPIENTQKALIKLFSTDPKDAIAAFARIKAALISQGVSAADVDKQFAKYEKTAGALGEALAPLTEKQQAQAEATKAQQAAAKALITSLDKYGAEAGPIAQKVADSMDLSRDAVDKLTESTKKMNDGIDKAFNSAGSVIDDWSTKAHFDLGKFEQDLLKQTVATANWSRNIAALSKAGIDQGFLQTLIDAGPKAATEVQGLVDGVSKGSVTAINAIVRTGKTAAGSAKSTVDAGLLGIRASFADFIAFVNNAHPNLDVRIAGQSATADQIHSLALAQRGHVGLPFDDGGRVPGPKGSPVAATVHGGEFVLSNAMLDAAARGTANGFTAASGVSSSTATPEVVHREYRVYGPFALKAELDVHDIEATFRRMELLEPQG